MTRIVLSAALVIAAWAVDAARERKIPAPHALFVVGIPAARTRVRSMK